jgi:hypothetical protein
MKLMGKDITSAKVLAFVGERLAARGLSVSSQTELRVDGVEARVDPLSFNLHALEDNADATKGLPLETHRDGLAGRAVVLAKRLFRTAGQIFINEALGRQTAFNGHVRDSYAQLSAEVLRLRQRVAELEQQKTVVAAPVVAAPVAKPVLPPAPPPPAKPLPPQAPAKKPALAAKPQRRPVPAPPSAPRPPPRTSRRGK